MNGWDTDAYLTALTFDEGADRTKVNNLEQLFIGHGSYLRRDDQVLIHCLSKYTALVENFKDQPELIFKGQPTATVRIHTQ